MTGGLCDGRAGRAPDSSRALSQNLLHGLAFGKFVNELVEVAHVFEHGIFDVFDAHSAHNSRDEGSAGGDVRAGKKVFKGCRGRHVCVSRSFIETGEPFDDFVEFGFRAALAFDLRDIQGIHLRELHSVDPAESSFVGLHAHIVAACFRGCPNKKQGSACSCLPAVVPVTTIATMTEPRVPAPIVPADGKLKGPASYFPSIEKTYGRPIQEWLDLTADRLDSERHMEVVDWLKTEHGLGHGHANAIVAYVKAKLTA